MEIWEALPAVIQLGGALFGKRKRRESPYEREMAEYLRQLREREAQREAVIFPLLQMLAQQIQAGITAPVGLSPEEILRMYAAQREQVGREAELLGSRLAETFASRFPGGTPTGLELGAQTQLGRALLETLARGQRELLLESERLRREQQARAMSLAAALAGAPTVIPQIGAGLGRLAEIGASRAEREALLGAYQYAQLANILGSLAGGRARREAGWELPPIPYPIV